MLESSRIARHLAERKRIPSGFAAQVFVEIFAGYPPWFHWEAHAGIFSNVLVRNRGMLIEMQRKLEVLPAPWKYFQPQKYFCNSGSTSWGDRDTENGAKKVDFLEQGFWEVLLVA